MARFKSTLEKQSTYKIAGFDVQFPMKPYGPQFTFMHKMLTTLELSRSSSSANALLESPTGTGKSLALLCAALAWQQHCRQHGCPPQVLDAGQSGNQDSSVPSGGGFIPDLNASPCNEDDAAPPKSGKGKNAAKKEEKKPAIPKIYYATRTHSQVGQVVRELSKTGYRTPMAILAARKHYCTHKTISKKKDINEECKKLLLESNGCSYNRNMSRVKTHPALQHGAVHEIHDIEDLVKLGKQVKGCSYFASRALAAEASIVFCPYNYIIDPVIRKAMNIDINNSIIILDEAHNIEDVAREAASTCVDLVALDEVRLELQKMVHEEGQQETYQPLIDMVDGLIAWINEKSRSLKKDGQERYHNEWFGDPLLSELDAAGIQPHSLNILLSCFQKVSQQAGEAKPGELHVNGQAVATMEGLFTSLRFMLSNEERRLNDFCMVLQRFVKRGEGSRGTVWTTELSLWCLNPAVAFEEVAAAARSIILTSGTLSPMDSFEKELGCQFSITMEGSHVIDMEKQIWGGVVGVGPNDVVLNASYRNADGADFQDSLGRAIEECASIVPDGLLIFFPSYKLMEKLSARWKSTGQWQKIVKKKPIYSEPRGGDDQFEKALAGYYSTIKKVQKRRSKTGPLGDEEDPDKGISGAIFLAVCRGKVSEGIDFADGNARAVIVVGIPFPYAMDLQVVFKKQFNTVNQKSRDLLSGDQWYCQQAFRALNQAIGRCIRHRYDFGAVLLFDERFHRPSNTQSLSKWLRGSIAKYSNFQDSMDSLRNYFKGLELEPPKPAPPPAVATSKSASKFHPMFNKTFDSSTGRPTPTQPAKPTLQPPPPVTDLAAEPAEALAERLSGFRASPSGRHEEGSAQKAGYMRKYEATQPTRAEKRQSVRGPFKSPFWNEEGFVDPVPEATSSEGVQKPELQKQACRPNEPLDKDSLESLEALVAECREEESRHALPVDSNAGAGVSESKHENGRWNGPAGVERALPCQPRAQAAEPRKSRSSIPFEQLGVCQEAVQSCRVPQSTSFRDGGAAQLSCSRCGAEVACEEVTQTSVRKAFLKNLLDQNRAVTGASGKPADSPLDVLLVKASALSSTSGRGGDVPRAVWAQEDGCVFEPVECPGCGAGGAVVGAKVLATDTANSFLNGQALLFPELLYRAPPKLLDGLPSDQPGSVPTPPNTVALPSPSNSGSQPATLLEGESSRQANQPGLHWNGQQASNSAKGVIFPRKVTARDLLFTPAADLVSPAGHVSDSERRAPQPMGGEHCSAPHSTVPLYVAPVNGKRRSLQAGVPSRPAAVLSASEANVLNAGSPLAGRSRSSQGKATKAGEGKGGSEAAPMLGPSNEAEAIAWQDVRKRAAGKKRKLSTTKAESKRPLDVIAETDSEDEEKSEKPAIWRKLVKIHPE